MALLSLGVNAPSGNRGRSRTARALFTTVRPKTRRFAFRRSRNGTHSGETLTEQRATLRGRVVLASASASASSDQMHYTQQQS